MDLPAGFVVLDFETAAIEPRPAYPPEPVGVALRHRGRSVYLAWGHPSGNNTTRPEAIRHLREILTSGAVLVGHGLGFDLAVATERLGLPMPSWGNLRDTLLLAFLADPNRRNLSLKPLAQEVLGEPPSERDKLYDWIRLHVPEAKRRKNVGAWISRAPGTLVASYAKGDVTRPEKLWRALGPCLDTPRMAAAHEREQRLLPILLGMDQRGVPIDAERLARDAQGWERRLGIVERWVRKRLDVPEHPDLLVGEALADALERARAVTGWIETKTGKRSVAIEALRAVCVDAPLLNMLDYRGKLALALRTFARPWLAQGKDRIWTHWNQVRMPGEEHGAPHFGARTGRLSSNPNFQNIPRVPGAVCFDAKADALRLPKELLREQKSGWDLPNLRDYVQAPPGYVLLTRDYSQQELRILAHYAGGVLRDAYLQNPALDLHEHARRLVNRQMRAGFPRRHIKNVGFGIIYGAGVGKTASMLDEEEGVVAGIRDAYYAIFPGLRRLSQDLKRRGRRGEWFETGGGRRFCVEPSVEGRSFEYKLLNTLVQGTAADVNKEAMVRYDADPKREGELLIQVHDELLVLVPKRAAAQESKRLAAAMEFGAEWFSLPLPTEGKMGGTWARMTRAK